MRIMSIFGNMRMRIKISCKCKYLQKIAFLGQKWVSLALSSILSAKNIMIVHPFWFYPSSGMKIKSPKSQNFGQEKMIFFYYWCGLCALMRIWCASMRISKNRRMASPSLNAFAVGIVKELKMYNKAQHDFRIIRIAFIFFICDEIDFVFIKLYEIIYMILWYLGWCMKFVQLLGWCV